MAVPAGAQVIQKPSGGGVQQGVPQGSSNSPIFGNPWAKPQSWQQAPVPYRDPSGRRPQLPCRYGEGRDAVSMYGCR